MVVMMFGMNWPAGYLARSNAVEPEVVVVAADLTQHDERLAQDPPLGI